jgi:hypothetical protein
MFGLNITCFTAHQSGSRHKNGLVESCTAIAMQAVRGKGNTAPAHS